MEIDVELLPHQRKFLESKERYSFMVIGRGGGKSWCLSVAVLLELLRGHNVLCMAQRYESLKEVLFREIKNRVFEWGLQDHFTFKENPVRAYCDNGATIFSGSYDNPDMCRGLSDIHMICCDEVALAPPDIFTILSPVLRGKDVKETRIIGATTPRMGSLWNVWFAEADRIGWEIITGSTFDNTFLSAESIQTIVDSIPSAEMREQELEGKILLGRDATCIIHLNEFPATPGITTDTRVIAGFDAAEGVERDCSAFVKRQGNKILEAWKINRIDHEECVRLIRESNRRQKIDTLNMDAGFSDYEFNILKYEIRDCNQINFASAATSDELKKKYANIRAQMYFNTADWSRHGGCIEGLELTPELKRQLCAITWHRDSQGRLLLVKKDELRAALKMSPDIADALALTNIDRYTGDDPELVRLANNPEVTRQRRRFARLMG